MRRDRAPEQGTHAAPELADRERFRDVVVGAELEAEHFVQLLATRRQHDDRNARLRAETLADLQTVEPREHHVEHHEVHVLLGEGPHGPRVRPPSTRARLRRSRRSSPPNTRPVCPAPSGAATRRTGTTRRSPRSGSTHRRTPGERISRTSGPSTWST